MTMSDESQERAAGLKMSNREQPMPVPGTHDVTPSARESFLTMLAEREQKGIATYGRTLQAFNGRDAVQDALEEVIDAFQYLVQIRIERDALIRERDAADSLAAALRADVERVTAERDSLRWKLGLRRGWLAP